MDLAFLMAFQIGVVDFGGSDLSQSCLTFYLAKRICMQRLSLLEATIQASFANRALFISLVFLNPRPLVDFGTQSLSQDL